LNLFGTETPRQRVHPLTETGAINVASMQTESRREAVVQQAAPSNFEFLDLKAQFATIRDEVLAAVIRVMESQHFILGPEVNLFEEETAAKLGVKHAIGCASGTDALILSLMAAEIGAGSEVITTPFSFVATAGSISRVGSTPVFVDIDADTFNIDATMIERAITPRTRAIMPVHLFGLSADMDPILAIARRHDLVVIEDAAQAIGSHYKLQNVGTLGDFGAFSFFPSKNLGAAGDGGLVVTNDDKAAERLRMLRVHGSKKKYHHDILGTNSRLDALQAAILRAKLRHLDDWTAGRKNRASRYREFFETPELMPFISSPREPGSGFNHVYNQFTIRCEFRDELQRHLRLAGIPTEIYYPLCLHLQPAFEYLGNSLGQFPAAEKASREVLSLPVFPELRDAQQDRVIQSIAEFCAQKT
jgi:dTDP-4-amino-4,6-dideoxygalactose transaminase